MILGGYTEGIYYSQKKHVVQTQNFTNGDIVGCELRNVQCGGYCYKIFRISVNGQYVIPARCVDDVNLFPIVRFVSKGSHMQPHSDPQSRTLKL